MLKLKIKTLLIIINLRFNKMIGFSFEEFNSCVLLSLHCQTLITKLGKIGNRKLY